MARAIRKSIVYIRFSLNRLHLKGIECMKFSKIQEVSQNKNEHNLKLKESKRKCERGIREQTMSKQMQIKKSIFEYCRASAKLVPQNLVFVYLLNHG